MLAGAIQLLILPKLKPCLNKLDFLAGYVQHTCLPIIAEICPFQAGMLCELDQQLPIRPDQFLFSVNSLFHYSPASNMHRFIFMVLSCNLPLVFTCLRFPHSQDGSSQLQVILNDLPTNDWNQVAEVFFKPGAVGCAEAILPSLVPKSFYAGEVTPPNSLHIGISVDALQWLSHAPPVGCKDSLAYQDGGMSLPSLQRCIMEPSLSRQSCACMHGTCNLILSRFVLYAKSEEDSGCAMGNLN